MQRYMCHRSARGIHHSQLGSTPLGVGPPENHRLSNFHPWTLLLLDLSSESLQFLHSNLRNFYTGFGGSRSYCTFTSVCEPCRPIPHLTLSFFNPRVLQFTCADLAFFSLQISFLTLILLFLSLSLYLTFFLPTATTRAVSATCTLPTF
ncbi:hypothetical protein N7455_000917 [Penicillium solitum]|uniref:uncharacterized protein n=1 Tax=Penicillium solitum TaxID=60172 RepID=UPI0032C3F65A|nr:hypothetical protein N7536_006602 [Penicillium majusculum]KAJ5877452.1 hypothetical protein N7455_000917 [Penicillium solitum]